MRLSRRHRLGIFVLLVSLYVLPGTGSVALGKYELKCSTQLSKAAQKLSTTVYRELSRCRSGRIEGTVTAVCPTPKSIDKD